MSRRSKILLKVLLTVTILGATLSVVGVGGIVDAIKRLDAGSWLFACGCFFAIHALATFKWRFFMRLSGARLGLRDGFRCYAAGLFANLCLPSMIGGDVLRAGLAMAASRQKTAVVLGSIVDRSSDFVGLGLLGLIGFLVTWRPSGGGTHAGGGWTPYLVAGAAAVLAIAGAVILWRRWRPVGKVRRIILEVLVALRRLRNNAMLASAGVLASAFLQFLLILVHRQLGIGIGMPADLGIWLFVWPLAKVAAMLPISLGGLGVREAAFLALGRPFGIEKSVAVATSLAWQAVLLVGGLAGGAVWLLLTWRPETRMRRPERQAT